MLILCYCSIQDKYLFCNLYVFSQQKCKKLKQCYFTDNLLNSEFLPKELNQPAKVDLD